MQSCIGEGHLLRAFPQLRVVVAFGGGGGGDRGGLREQAFRNGKYEWLLIWNGGRSLQLKKASFRVGEGECFQIQRRKP